jgi:hypothetical protein
MIRVETDNQGQPFERNPAIDGFIEWRDKMEEMRRSGRWNLMAVQYMLKSMACNRDGLAPWEWIWCPDCDGRGLWVDGGNHWCPRCSGTRILLAEELTDPAEIALIHKTAPPPDWGRLWSRKP